MRTANCSKTVFPDRYVGRVTDGYEASFVVLQTNPFDDWGATKTIIYKFKDGRPLDLE